MTDLSKMMDEFNEDDIKRVLAERHLHEFIKQCWPTMEPGRHFHDNWHIQAICEHLEAVMKGDIRRLIINIPPRHMKSLTCNVAFPTWAWIHRPHIQFMFASYAGTLSVRDSVKCRRLIQSKWYSDNWGDKYHLTGDQNQKQRFENSHNGHRLSTSTSGSLTGEGGDIICFPHWEIVHTEHGPRTIGSIVDSKEPINVWSFNTETNETSLKPVIGYFKNPASDIIEVGFDDGATIHCTPDHKIWTNDGWVEARLLTPSHQLPPPVVIPTIQQSSVFYESSLFSFLDRVLAPRLTAPNVHDTDETSPILGCYNFIGFGRSGYRLDDSELERCHFAAGTRGPMQSSIFDIVQPSSVRQITQSIVQGISIQVSYFLSFWAGSNEGDHKKLVKEDPVGFTFSSKIASGVRATELHNLTGENIFPRRSGDDLIKASNNSVRMDFVQGLEPRDRRPTFVRNICHVENSYCLEVQDNNTFIVGANASKTVIVSNCIDDPHNVKEAESDAVRNSVLEWWDTAVQSRLNDPTTGAFVLIMQRVHQYDLTGHILHNQLASDPWTHLCVPAEYEKEHPHIYTSTLAEATHHSDPRTEEGALLWPNRFPQKALDTLKHGMGEYASAGQLQQRPSPKGGGILKSKWWRKWETLVNPIPKFIYVLQSWDTAYSEKKTASYSACTTWGIFAYGGSYHAMIMHRYRERLAYSSLRKHARELYNEYKPDAVLIEKKASGQSLIQELQQSGIPAIPYSPDRDKVARAHAVSPLFEAGFVWYPDRKWAEEVIQHCAIFPAGDGADIVDTVTQALIRLRKMWYVSTDETDEDLKDTPDREDSIQDSSNVVPLERKAIYG